MPNLQDLQAKRLRIESDIATLAERAADSLTDGERERLTGLQNGLKKVREQERDALIEGAESGEFDVYNVNDGLSRGREDVRDDRVWTEPLSHRAPLSDVRSRALTAVERMGNASDSVRKTATDFIERHDDRHGTIARMAVLTSSPDYVRAFERVMQNPQMPMLTEKETHALRQGQELQRAMSLTDSAGGYLVPFQLDPTVIITSDGSTNPIRSIARKVVATGDTWNGVSSASVSWSWDAEATEVSDDATTFAQPSIPIHKAAGFVPISLEALQDEANVAREVGRLLAFGKDTLESAAFTNGSGSGQPTGIAIAVTTTGDVDATTGGVFGMEDVFLLDESLPARYRANASWLAHRAIWNDIAQFESANAAALAFPSVQGPNPTLLNRPAYESSDMSSTITTDQLVLLFGDFSEYVIADRIGTTVEFIPHLFATGNNRPSGQRGWYAYYRTGADSVNDNAFKLLRI